MKTETKKEKLHVYLNPMSAQKIMVHEDGEQETLVEEINREIKQLGEEINVKLPEVRLMAHPTVKLKELSIEWLEEEIERITFQRPIEIKIRILLMIRKEIAKFRVYELIQ